MRSLRHTESQCEVTDAETWLVHEAIRMLSESKPEGEGETGPCGPGRETIRSAHLCSVRSDVRYRDPMIKRRRVGLPGGASKEQERDIRGSTAGKGERGERG
eukprot:2176003-Rhodomonas_salina.3